MKKKSQAEHFQVAKHQKEITMYEVPITMVTIKKMVLKQS